MRGYRRRPWQPEDAFKRREQRQAARLLYRPLKQLSVGNAQPLRHAVRPPEADINLFIGWVPFRGLTCQAVGGPISVTKQRGSRTSAGCGGQKVPLDPDHLDVGPNIVP